MMITAHSGSDGTEENSLHFVREMLKGGVRCIELDVRRSTEGKLYLSHDSALFTANVVTLDSVFRLVANKGEGCCINCDLKEEGLEEEVYLLAEKRNLEQQIFFSGNVNTDELASEVVQKNVYYNVENCFTDLYENPEMTGSRIKYLIKYCKEKGIAAVNIYYRLCSEAFMQAMSEQGINISVWTVDDIETIEYFQRWNVINVTTRSALKYLQKKEEELREVHRNA